jgi:hypothetical protein
MRNIEAKKGLGCSSVVEHLLSVGENVGSTPDTAQNKKNKPPWLHDKRMYKEK